MVFCAGLSVFGAVVSQLGIRNPDSKKIKRKSPPFDLGGDDSLEEGESDSDSIVQ